MSKTVKCDGCGGEILNPKSIVKVDADLTLCLSCFESERQSTPQFPSDYDDDGSAEEIGDSWAGTEVEF